MRGEAHGWARPFTAIPGLGAAAMAAGLSLTRRYVDRARREGTVGFA
ncbi:MULTISPECIES: hypothetical protein [Actinomadura]|nr:hypothetical protein [Actinomadura madurae]